MALGPWLCLSARLTSALFHTEAAKLFGATEEEIQEAVHFARFTVGWSVYLNGIREDYDEFLPELQQIGEHLSQQP
jgi:alkylhydroperoxidase/carboxymuconolactone decarboxylase family protein YurZ